MMYVCTHMYVHTLRNAVISSKPLKFINHEDGMRFSTFEIRGRAPGAIRVCRVIAATCEVEQ